MVEKGKHPRGWNRYQRLYEEECKEIGAMMYGHALTHRLRMEYMTGAERCVG